MEMFSGLLARSLTYHHNPSSKLIIYLLGQTTTDSCMLTKEDLKRFLKKSVTTKSWDLSADMLPVPSAPDVKYEKPVRQAENPAH